MKLIFLLVIAAAVAVLAQERIVELSTPVEITSSISQISPRQLVVDIQSKKATLYYKIGEKVFEANLFEGEAYDASGLTNFWPVISNRVVYLATNNLLQLQ